MCKQSLLCFLDNFLLLCYTTHRIKLKGFFKKMSEILSKQQLKSKEDES